jgi:hypothetical protein
MTSTLHVASVWSEALILSVWVQGRCGTLVTPTTGPLCALLHDVGDALAPLTGPAAAYLGPALTWLPILLLLLFSRRSSDRSWRLVLAAAQIGWLFLIHPVRWTVLLTGRGGWDPSGHVFMAGVQLAPLWVLSLPQPATRGRDVARAGASGPTRSRSRSGRPSLRRGSASAFAPPAAATPNVASPLSSWRLLLEAPLWLISLSSAALRHSGTEIFAAWLLVLVVLVACTAAQREAGRSKDAARVSLLWLSGAAGWLWLAGGAVMLAAISQGTVAGLPPFGLTLAHLSFDAGVLLCARWLLTTASGIT